MDIRSLNIESLERREMLAYSISDGVLTLDASAEKYGAFWTLEDFTPGYFRLVDDSGNRTLIDSEGVNSIKFIGSDAGDSFRNESSLPTESRGRGGNDLLSSTSDGSKLYGGAGDDNLRLFKNGEVFGKVFGELFGGGDNDVLSGSGILNGGPGNDDIQGHYISSIYGGAGDDDIETFGIDTTNLFADGSTFVNAGSGDDHISVFGGWNRIVAGPDFDIVDESFSENFEYVEGGLRIVGGDGVDHIGPFSTTLGTRIWGGDGDDFIRGSRGRDLVHGGDGEDKIYGHGGNDHLYGDAENDIIRGGSNRDKLFGGNGNDRLFGDDGNDELFGGNQDDELYGGNHRDIIRGGPGDDLLRGEAGVDNLIGGGGIDSLFGGIGNADELGGGGGQDRIYTKEGDETIRLQNGDAVFLLEDGDNFAGGNGYSGRGVWKESNLKYVDKAFGLLQSTAGDSRIIKDSISPMQPIRLHMVSGLKSNGQPANAVNFEYSGWYTLFNRIRIIAFNQDSLNQFGSRFQSTVIHEVGHTWDELREIKAAFPNSSDKWKLVKKFQDLSGWSSKSEGPTWIDAVGHGYFDGNSKIMQKYGYQFAREYGARDPHEDFATAFESVFRNSDYRGHYYRKIPEKISVVVDLFGLTNV